MDDLYDVVVATIAFGMGVHKGDIRMVVHYGVPNSTSSYYQETGRAGRDGGPATAILFFRAGDIQKRRGLMNFSLSTGATTQSSSLPPVDAQLNKFAKFLNSTECRRASLLGHFGEGAGTFAIVTRWNTGCNPVCTGISVVT